jgi:hypothetical protein
VSLVIRECRTYRLFSDPISISYDVYTTVKNDSASSEGFGRMEVRTWGSPIILVRIRFV